MTFNLPVRRKNTTQRPVKAGSRGCPDYKLALTAAKNLNGSYELDRQLYSIAVSAAGDKKTLGYAIVAAELSSGSHAQNKILNIVVSVLSGEVPNIGVPIEEPKFIDPSQFSDFEKYKYMFRFADSVAGFDMSEEDAKQFVDDWLKHKSFEEFLEFQSIYSVADNSRKLDMDEDSAIKFTQMWIDKGYSEEDLTLFTDAYVFAYRGSDMDMSSEDAMAFAYKQLEEHLTAKKAVSVSPENEKRED